MTAVSDIRPSRVAVVSLAVGKYVDFLDRWADSIRAKFLPGVDKTMFVFSDAQALPADDLRIIPASALPWPLTTLFKFRYFRGILPELRAYDWVVHIDMDMFVNEVVEPGELLSVGTEYFGTRHPYWTGDFSAFRENNPASRACMDESLNVPAYWQGCFWGGRSRSVQRLIEQCAEAVDADLTRNVIARWHDESHLNRFLALNQDTVKTLTPAFAYPERWDGRFDRKIVHVHKDDVKYQNLVGLEDAPERARVAGALQPLTLRAKDLVRKAVRRAGYEIRRAGPAGPLASGGIDSMSQFLRSLKARGMQPRCILDVGANQGDWATLAAKIFPAASLILVEPQQEMAAPLARFCSSHHAARFHLAGAAAIAGEAVLTVWEDLQGSSYLPAQDPSAIRAGRQRKTPMVTIDSILLDGEVPDIVKLDIQGYEIEALRGASRLFGPTEVFVLEACLFEFSPGMPSIFELIEFMHARDYVLYDICGFLRRPLDGALGAIDLAFVKSRGPFRANVAWSELAA
jgi:FkbM family methyltransferase